MGLNFPAAPLVGDVYPVPALPGVPQWTWNGVSWKCGTIDTANYIRKSGDTMTGPLVLAADPVADMQAATRRYADAISTENALINGFMDVSQERAQGTGVAIGAGATYIVDQWWAQASVGSFSSAQQACGIGGIPNQISLTNNAGAVALGANDVLAHGQYVEGSRWGKFGWGTVNALPISIGFWVYANVSGTAYVTVRNGDNSRTCAVAYTTVGSQWLYRTVTIPPCLDGSWNVNQNIGSQVIWCWGSGRVAPSAGVWHNALYDCGPGQTNYFNASGMGCYITGVTIVPGSVAVPQMLSLSKRRDYQTEFLLCARYLQFNKYAEAGHALGPGSFYIPHNPLVPYRVTPALSLTTTSFYAESSPWAAGINITGATVNASHMNPYGGDYQIAGTCTPALPASAGTNAIGLYSQPVKFSARF